MLNRALAILAAILPVSACAPTLWTPSYTQSNAFTGYAPVGYGNEPQAFYHGIPCTAGSGIGSSPFDRLYGIPSWQERLSACTRMAEAHRWEQSQEAVRNAGAPVQTTENVHTQALGNTQAIPNTQAALADGRSDQSQGRDDPFGPLGDFRVIALQLELKRRVALIGPVTAKVCRMAMCGKRQLCQRLGHCRALGIHHAS